MAIKDPESTVQHHPFLMNRVVVLSRIITQLISVG